MEMDDDEVLEALRGKTITRAELLNTVGDPVDPNDPDGPTIVREELVLFFSDDTQLNVISAELLSDGRYVDGVAAEDAPDDHELHSTGLLYDLDAVDPELVRMLDESDDDDEEDGEAEAGSDGGDPVAR